MAKNILNKPAEPSLLRVVTQKRIGRFGIGQIIFALLVLTGIGGYFLVHNSSTVAADVTCTVTASPGDDIAGDFNTMTAGQTLCLNPGTYGNNTSQWNFTNSVGVNVTSTPGNTSLPIIDGASYIAASNADFSYLKFDQNNADVSWPGLCQGAIPGGAMITNGLTIDGSNVTLERSEIYVDSSVPLTSRGGGVGVGFSNPTSGVTIRYNRIHDTGFCPVEQHGIYLNQTTGAQIYGNWIYNEPAGTGVQVWDGPQNAHIYANVIENTSSCFDIGGSTPNTNGTVIEHNICANSSGMQAPYTNYCNYNGSHPMFAYCTGYDPGVPLFDYWGTNVPGTGNVMQNNDMWCVSATHCSTSFANAIGVTLTGNTVSNPQFADPNYQTSHDYRVASTSPAAAWGLWDGNETPPAAPPVPTSPATPIGLMATASSNGSVALSWKADATSDNVAHYNVYRADQTTGPVAAPTTPGYTDSGLTLGTQYCYQVSATNSIGESTQSASVCAIPPVPTPPATPSGLTATALANSGGVSLTWSANAASDNVTHYNVYRTDLSPTVPLAQPTTTSFSNASLTIGKQYCYQISATNANGESTKTTAVCAVVLGSPPATPTGLTATAQTTSGGIALAWKANVASDNVTHYNVYRTDQSATVAWAKPTTTSYTDTTQLTIGKQYCYQISATNANGESSKTATACAIASTTHVPAVPTGLVAKASGLNIVLTWNANPITDGVTHYNVYRTDQTFTSPWATTTLTTYTNGEGVVKGKQFCYQISATNNKGDSAKTTAVCIKP